MLNRLLKNAFPRFDRDERKIIKNFTPDPFALSVSKGSESNSKQSPSEREIDRKEHI